MHRVLVGWVACPRCGGDLVDSADGATCETCSTAFDQRDGLLNLVDATQRVSSEGPGDTLAMAWRRRRWDELRGADAPENAAYLAAIWERLRPDDRVLDVGCGPASFAGWMAEFAPELAIFAIDLSWGALEEAQRTTGQRANVALARASARRRLPVHDSSCDVVLRRLAPGLPEEIVRAIAPGGYYLRFTFGPNHWREVYDRVPGLPRAREDTLAGEVERLRQLGLEVEEPIREGGEEEMSLPGVLLALRSNPAAFHADRLDLRPMRQLWHLEDGSRAVRVPLTTDYAILIARRPGGASPALARAPAAQPATAPAAPAPATPDAEQPTPAHRRPRRAAPSPAGATPADAAQDAPPSTDTPATTEATSDEPPPPAAPRRRARPAAPPADAAPIAEVEAPARRRARRTTSERPTDAPTGDTAEPPPTSRHRARAATPELPAEAPPTPDVERPTPAQGRAGRSAPSTDAATPAESESAAPPRRRTRRATTPQTPADAPTTGESDSPAPPPRRGRRAEAVTRDAGSEDAADNPTDETTSPAPRPRGRRRLTAPEPATLDDTPKPRRTRKRPAEDPPLEPS